MTPLRIGFSVAFAVLASIVSAEDEKPVVVKFLNLTATAPANWKSEKPSNLLRSHQFKIASGEPNLADAEIAIYKEGSPKFDQKFAEWKATFNAPEGKTVDDLAKIFKMELTGATGHVLDMTGTWRYRERPRDPRSKEEIKPDYRAVWVVVIQGEECTHIRFSGPKSVVEKNYPAFEQWLKSAK